MHDFVHSIANCCGFPDLVKEDHKISVAPEDIPKRDEYIFQRLFHAGLGLDIEKSKFLQLQVKFLDHLISPEGI